MDFDFLELNGQLPQGGFAVPQPANLVVLSNLLRGQAESPARDWLSLKFVAQGVEVYRYDGKTYSVGAGQFLAVPPQRSGDVEISRSAGDRAIGMCVTLDAASLEPGGLESPMLFPAQCSILGRLLTGCHARLVNEPQRRPATARALIERARLGFGPLLEETFGQLAGIEATRPSTRYELLRKLNLARSYLHAVADRPVPLPELAKAAGVSQFHLLRNFRSCFGQSPSAYHRRIRLEAGKRAIDRNEMSCSQAAHRFGFADSSSFSHAYRRTFGTAPNRAAGAS